MNVSPFINLYRTKDEAFYFKNSQENTQYIFKGVQLLPNNEIKYVQLTETPFGINLEDWAVFVVDLKTGLKTDITDYFLVESLTNSLDGSPQFFWSIQNLPFDFGYRLIYLEVNQLVGDVFYSNPFMITEIESEKVSQFHYKESIENIYQSIGIQFWFLDEDKKTDLTTYYEVSTKNTVSRAIKTSIIEIYRTEIIAKNILILLSYLLESPILFVNNKRFYLFEALELKQKTAQENFGFYDVKLSPNNGLLILPVDVVPPVVDILPYILTFSDGTNADKEINFVPYFFNAILTNPNASDTPATYEMSLDLGVTYFNPHDISNTHIFSNALTIVTTRLWLRVRNLNLAGNVIYSNTLKVHIL